MSGDCGHGWGYHFEGPGGPCFQCIREERNQLRLQLDACQNANARVVRRLEGAAPPIIRQIKEPYSDEEALEMLDKAIAWLRVR